MELQQHLMKSLSGSTDQSMALSEQLDRIATDLKAGRLSNNQALDEIVEFVQHNMKLELSREHLDAKIAGFSQLVDIGSLTSSLAQVKVMKRRIETLDRKIAVVAGRLKHEV